MTSLVKPVDWKLGRLKPPSHWPEGQKSGKTNWPFGGERWARTLQLWAVDQLCLSSSRDQRTLPGLQLLHTGGRGVGGPFVWGQEWLFLPLKHFPTRKSVRGKEAAQAGVVDLRPDKGVVYLRRDVIVSALWPKTSTWWFSLRKPCCFNSLY